MRRSWQFVLLITLLLGVAGCGTRQSDLPAEEQSPAKILFNRGTESYKTQHYAEALTLFETLLNSYPDSEYVDRTKLVLKDCDGITACADVRAQVWGHLDEETFFPNMPEERPQ